MNCYRCQECSERYYSAAELEHLENKNCECGGELKDETFEGPGHAAEWREDNLPAERRNLAQYVGEALLDYINDNDIEKRGERS